MSALALELQFADLCGLSMDSLLAIFNPVKLRDTVQE